MISNLILLVLQEASYRFSIEISSAALAYTQLIKCDIVDGLSQYGELLKAYQAYYPSTIL